MLASLDPRTAAPRKQDTVLDAPTIVTLSERFTPEQADGNFIACLMSLGVVMGLTAVDSFLFAIRLTVKDMLLVELDTFRVAMRVIFWASSRMVIRDWYFREGSVKIAGFQFNGNGSILTGGRLLSVDTCYPY
jgi:hypothetical protein